MQVVIIGGGISGLATAYFLQEQARTCNTPIDITLIERSAAFGGKIVSERNAGFVIEAGPDSFITQKPAAVELCNALGLGDQLVGTNDAMRNTFIWSRGRLRKLPDGVMLLVPTKLGPFLRSSLISWPGKLRMALDVVIPPRQDDGDASLAQFVRRRLGAEALDKLAEPLIAGIYVGDAERLSLKSTFPRFLELERAHGSLIRGMHSQRRRVAPSNGAAPLPLFMTLRGGLGVLVDALVARLQHAGAHLLQGRVQKVVREQDGYTLRMEDGVGLRADTIIFATPAHGSAQLVEGIDPELATALRQIPYVSSATVSLGFRRAELGHALDGFGFVVPRSERRKLRACTWSSSKFPHRAAAGYALVRGFVGGPHAENLLDQDDDALIELVRGELRVMMGITAAPVLARVFRWPRANPQYEVGHHERVTTIERLVARHPGMHMVGSAYHGVGIPDCIQGGARVAAKVLGGQE